MVEELKQTDRVNPRRFENVAVLFCDIVGFTPYCDRTTPEEVVGIPARSCSRPARSWPWSYGVQKIKTIGDAFMAAAGLLRPVQNPVLNCVRCGLEMISAAQHSPVRLERARRHPRGPGGGGRGRPPPVPLRPLGRHRQHRLARGSHGAPGAVNLKRRRVAAGRRRYQSELLGLFSVKGEAPIEICQILT